MKGSLAILSLLTSQLKASPVPQDQEPTVTVIGPGDPDRICSFTYENPDLAWRNSGAAVFLDKWLAEHGENNWAYEMDLQTTAGGSQGTAVLNCLDFNVNNCDYPTKLCKEYTPPELWHIRKAMANAYRMTRAMFDAFQRSIIKQHLDAGSIISDFGPASSTFNIFGGLSGAFSIAAGTAAAFIPVAGPASIMSGIFGILASDSSSTQVNLAEEIDTQLSQAFSKAEEQTSAFLKLVFGGSGNTSSLPDANIPGSNGEMTNIARFFSGGKFLFDITPERSIDSAMNPLIQSGATYLRQRMVNAVLKAQGYYIWIDGRIKNQNQCTGADQRWIDNECFGLHRFVKDGNHQGSGVAIDSAKVSKLEDPNSNYNMNVEWFYRYSDVCQKAHPNYDGDLASTGFPLGGSVPECFFNIPVLRAEVSPCVLLERGEQLPSNLGINYATCSPSGACLNRPEACP